MNHPPTRAPFPLVGMLGAFVFAAAVYVLFVLTATGQAFDDLGLLGQRVQTDAWLDRARVLLSLVSVTTVGLQFAALCIAAWVRRGFAAGAVVGITLVTAVLGAEVLKHWILPRPDLPGIADSLDVRGYNTLPSGHTTIATSIALGLVLVVAPRWRGPAVLVAALSAAAVGASTLEAGWHRTSDAIAAYGWTLGVFLVAVLVLRRLGMLRPSTESGSAVWVVVVLAVIAILALAAALRIGAALIDTQTALSQGPDALSPAQWDGVFTTGWLLAATTGTAVAVLFYAAVRGLDLSRVPSAPATDLGTAAGESAGPTTDPDPAGPVPGDSRSLDSRAAARRALDQVELVPEQTTDDLPEPTSGASDLRRLLDDVPPHHIG